MIGIARTYAQEERERLANLDDDGRQIASLVSNKEEPKTER